MSNYNNDKIIYAVGVEWDGKPGDNKKISYATVQRKELGAHVTFEIINRSGVQLTVDNDSIDALIAALQQAKRSRFDR